MGQSNHTTGCKGWKHLNEKERYKIEGFLGEGYKPGEIARENSFYCPFFGYLFHELGHCSHYSRQIVDTALGCATRSKEHNDKEGERYAKRCEIVHTVRFLGILQTKGILLEEIANHLFYWDKLKPIVLSPGDKKART